MKELKINKIKEWLERTVIGLNLCPWAESPYRKGRIHFSCCEAKELKDQLLYFLDELDLIQMAPPEKISTSLVIFEKAPDDFLTFYSFQQECEDLIAEAGLGDVFLTIPFHPGFKFEGLADDDRANYVNRSPFPLIHILRKADLDEAVKDIDEGESISIANEKKLNSLSQTEFHFHFPASKKESSP